MQWTVRILVTGGAGFIGANFLNLFVPRFPEHHFLNLDKLTYAANLASLADVADARNYRFERVDIADAEAVDDAFARFKPDLVVHFAAESHVDRSIFGPREFLATNVEGTFNLLQAARKHFEAHEGLFHHISTDEVFGSLGPAGAFDEETRYDPSSPYSASKAASDHLVRSWARTYGLPIKITNCSNNYGPRQFPEKLIPLMVLNAIERSPLPVYGEGKNIRDWLYVDDHCLAIWSVIEKGRVGETYTIGGNCQLSNIEVVRQVCRILAEEAGAPVAELMDLIVFVEDRPGHDLRYAIDASKVMNECGWMPNETFETGLRKTIRWYLDNEAWVQSVRTADYDTWLDKNYGEHRERGR
jgi:dTDP-glucose 4,6-dehydratase